MSATTVEELSVLLQHGDVGMSRPQIEHRFKLVGAQHWNIQPAMTVLEVGCGQGDATVVLASAVGATGHVTAIDPGPPSYGSPLTLEQAQAKISASPLGKQITFRFTDTLLFLAEDPHRTWDAAVLLQCLWYFASPDQILQTLSALAAHVTQLHISEYALSTADVSAVPHVLAALTQAMFEAFNPNSTSNIRTCISPPQIKALAAQAGWALDREAFVTPDEGYLDGVWETNHVRSPAFLQDIEDTVKDPRAKCAVLTARDAVIESRAHIQTKRVRSMDIWVASFSVAK